MKNKFDFFFYILKNINYLVMTFGIILVFKKSDHNLFKCKTKNKLKVKKKSVKWNNNLCEYCPNTVSLRELSPNERYDLKIYRYKMW